MRWMRFDAGVGSALLAGILFGASTPLAKRLIQDLDPWMLAGLLYLGSGLGLGAYRALRHAMRDGRATEASLRGADRWWLAAAILAGGIVAPVLMMYGLRRSAGSTASLLLNLEGVFTTLIAWFVFHENFDRRIALSVLAITAGAVLLSAGAAAEWGSAIGPLAIAGACLAWALDNNLTRKVALSDVTFIAMLKGLVAGSVNIALATASPNFLILEFHWLHRDYWTTITTDKDDIIKDGWITLSDCPGIGLELDETVARAHQYPGTTWFA